MPIKPDPQFVEKVEEAVMRFLPVVEGVELRSYLDTAGHWTIGVGHTGPDVKPGMSITRVAAMELLRHDVARFLLAVLQAVKVPLTVNQMAALVSFAFNVGINAFLGSTLLERINGGRLADVPTQLRRWNKEHRNGILVVSKGLTNRREAELKLWGTP